MISHSYSIRINYSDTDKMGFVHHSNYARIYENARWELLRKLGVPYSKIESLGIFMPVIDMDFKFVKPAFYDEELTVNVRINGVPTSRIKFEFELINKNNDTINTANLRCAFIDSKTHKAVRVPRILQSKIESNLSIEIR